MSNSKKQDEEVRELLFTVDNSIIAELGERLVAKPSIALAELIKNSYDADATEVTVKFRNIKKKGGQIVVSDNGLGMNEDELINSWMRIGTIRKVRKPRSEKYKRPRAGSKGVGRFASQALSHRLVVDTVSAKGRGRTKATLVINWRQFKAGRDIDSVPIKCKIVDVDSSTPTGTSLILISLKKKFSKKELSQVIKDIFTLTAPPVWESDMPKSESDKRDPGFNVKLEVPDYPELKGDVGTQFLGAAWGTLRGVINDKGHPVYTLTTKNEEMKLESNKELHHLKEARFVAYWVLYESREAFASLGVSLSAAQKYGRNYGGIRIHFDGFRIYPYGSPGNDWLTLDLDRSRSIGVPKESELRDLVETKSPFLSLPGNRNLFGAVFLSRFSSEVKISMARDRLIENDAYHELKDFVRYGIDWMTIKRAAYRVKQEETDATAVAETQDDSVTIFERVREEITEDETLEKSQKAELKTRLHALSKAVERERESLVHKVQILRVLASLGTSIAIFDHELSALLDSLEEVEFDLKGFIEHISNDKREEFTEVINEFCGWTDNVVELSSLIGIMAGSDARLKKRQIAMQDAVEKLVRTFRPYMDLKSIEFKNEIPPGLHSPRMLPAEFNSLLINLLTNSIKAVLSGGSRLEIMIRATATKKAMTIEFLDAGVGIDSSDWERVFEPFISLHGPDDRFGLGTGLGLTIVRDIVNEYNGYVSFVEPPEDWATCLQIELPY